MERKSRLDKAVNGLARILDRHNGFKDTTIKRHVIRIGNSGPQIWGTITYLVVIFILPTALIIYEYVNEESHYISLVILIVFLIVFLRSFFIMIRSENVTTLDLDAKRLKVKNVNGIFGRFFTEQEIKFNEISNVEIVIRTRRLGGWQELILHKKDGRQVILASFTDRYPASFIAEKVRFLFDVIIWMEKNS